MSTPGLALVVTGASLTAVATLAEAAAGWPGVRRVGRRVLAVLGPLTRPACQLLAGRRPRLRVTLDAAIAAELAAELDRSHRLPQHHSCSRRWHVLTWDGYHETCRRCGARRELVSASDDGTSIYRWRHL